MASRGLSLVAELIGSFCLLLGGPLTGGALAGLLHKGCLARVK